MQDPEGGGATRGRPGVDPSTGAQITRFDACLLRTRQRGANLGAAGGDISISKSFRLGAHVYSSFRTPVPIRD